MTSNAQQPQESPSSVSALPDLTYETFAHVMEMFPEVMKMVVTTVVGDTHAEFEVLLDEKSIQHGHGGALYYCRRVGLWRYAGQTKTSAQFMGYAGVSAASNHFLFLEDDGTRIAKSLEFTSVRWLDDLVIDVPDDFLTSM